MLMVGFSTRIDVCGHKGGIYVRNSWSEGWGQKGNCWISFDYIEACASDFWTIRKIEE